MARSDTDSGPLGPPGREELLIGMPGKGIRPWCQARAKSEGRERGEEPSDL